jgi:tyrosyl-tRNA synthetase
MTSTFDLYQFFVRSADADVERYLKLFTFLPIAQIHTIMDEHRLDKSKRTAQHTLAFEVVELIHGIGAAQSVQAEHRRLFNQNFSLDSLRADPDPSRPAPETAAIEARPPGAWNSSLNPYAKPTTAESASSVHLTLPQSLIVGKSFSKVLWSAGLVSSKTEAARLILNKGCYVGSKIGKGGTATTMGDSLNSTAVAEPNSGESEMFIIDGDVLIITIGK